MDRRPPAIFVGDALGVTATLVVVAGVVLATLPLAVALRPALAAVREA